MSQALLLLIVRIIVLVLSAPYICESLHGPLRDKRSALLTVTLYAVESFLLELKADVAQNCFVTVEGLLISIDRSAFRFVSHGVRKEPPAF
jgi:hypothetical protein